MMFFSAKQRPAEYLRYISFILLVFILHACGFQLRGAVDISEDISPIYLQQNSAFELDREIKSMLAANNISLEKNASKANSQLTLLNEIKSRRVLSVDANGRAKEYLLNYTVNFAIKIKQSEEVVDSISLSRSLLFDPEAVLAVTNESEILYKDMQRDASRLILLKLQARPRKNTGNEKNDNNAASEQIENINSQ